MDRRAFFALKPASNIPAEAPFGGLRQITTGLNTYAGTWSTNEVTHLLKRTMFGARKEDIDHFKSLSMSQAVDELLNVPVTTPAPPVKNYTNEDINPADPDYAIPVGSTWVNTHSGDGQANFNRVLSWKDWWVGRMINQERNIGEKMILFWHNHFATEASTYQTGIYGYRHYLLLKQFAMGNFKQLVRGVTLDLAMLNYLNGQLNTDTAPDENYARELQELFTLGKENNPNYQEPDVFAAARVLTGWRINEDTDTVFFDVTKHDKDPKKFSSFYNGTTIAGRSDANAGNAELDDLLNMIFAKQVEVSEFIVKKIYRFFVYYTIDANTETNVIKPLAQVFRNNNWEIKPVLSLLFKSEHFFDALSQGCLIKSPLDLLVGLCREFAVAFPAASDTVNYYNMLGFVRFQAGEMQEDPGDPPGVSGWPAYYQIPQFHETWINSDTLPKRNIFSDMLIGMGYTRNGMILSIDPIKFTESLPNAVDPNALINDALDILYRVPISAASKAAIKKSILLTGQTQDYYWSNAWNAYRADPTNMTKKEVVFLRLKSLYKYLMNLAEYQLA
ncbi:DUF1800 domain-containing protein [Pseudoflavitalea sp. G-6-1-2]|uniref:DUF1800 domain-containing protein n=1 Tax=Pseudoflavitalea sp. G-6-1-2 TaxID=2728841 RepID=UPI00146C5521|nr:DUF1800 domain-containing protein [Pseudoflavitalea sp. G-6-1-2]NML20597.1 DUF1800 domain-containing protein [Pseudoflavitalea sp. G-6-1-2]